jgi:hypothetical protein
MSVIPPTDRAIYSSEMADERHRQDTEMVESRGLSLNVDKLVDNTNPKSLYLASIDKAE